VRLAAVKDSLPDPSTLGGLTIRQDTASNWRYDIYDESQGEITPGQYLITMGGGLGAVGSSYGSYPSFAYWLYVPDGKLGRSITGASKVVNGGQPIWAAVFTGLSEAPDYNLIQPDLYLAPPCGGLNSDGQPDQVGCSGGNAYILSSWQAVSSFNAGTFDTWTGTPNCNGYSVTAWLGDEPNGSFDFNCADYGYWNRYGVWVPYDIEPPVWGARWMPASGIPNDPLGVSAAIGAGGVSSDSASASEQLTLNWDLDAHVYRVHKRPADAHALSAEPELLSLHRESREFQGFRWERLRRER
jgi:hypothetical protein